jgi:hypothetical protein
MTSGSIMTELAISEPAGSAAARCEPPEQLGSFRTAEQPRFLERRRMVVDPGSPARIDPLGEQSPDAREWAMVDGVLQNDLAAAPWAATVRKIRRVPERSSERFEIAPPIRFVDRHRVRGHEFNQPVRAAPDLGVGAARRSGQDGEVVW